PYLFGDIRNRRISIWYNWITYNRNALCLVANLFHTRGIGPRIYDLIEIDCGGYLWSAYVVAHITGRAPSPSECRAGIDEIKRLETEGLLKLTLTEGYDDQDLTPPTCNNNAFVDDEDRFRYVDFQSFLLVGYQQYLNRLAERYRDPLLKTIDNSAPDARNRSREIFRFISEWKTPERYQAIGTLLSKAGIRLENRLLLGLDADDAFSFAYLLSRGAKWCHGWSNPEMAGCSEELLRALGCTRFSLSLVHKEAFEKSDEEAGLAASCTIESLPDFLKPQLNGCVVLASHLHRPAQRAVLEKLNWAYLISLKPETGVHLPGCRVGGQASYEDSNGEIKTISLFINQCAKQATGVAKMALTTSSMQIA
ncbi:MAG TPA: hypothetical protein VEZ90_11215, partial [Blastocatellia bacterium]|nr:hypothetical protein [Blastocatellia bacterium]